MLKWGQNDEKEHSYATDDVAARVDDDSGSTCHKAATVQKT